MKLEIVRVRALYVGRRIGPVGWGGLAALTLASVVLLAGPIVVDPSNRGLSEELAQLKQQLDRSHRPPTLAAVADPVALIVAQLPPPEQVPRFVREVQEEASRRGLQIDRTEYRVQKSLGARALRYQLTMPAHGSYPQLRAWLEALLHDYPSAALDELSLRREADGAGRLEAHVTLSLYSQGVL